MVFIKGHPSYLTDKIKRKISRTMKRKGIRPPPQYGPRPQSFKDKMSNNRMGKGNPAWIDGRSRYQSLHAWVIKMKDQPKLCEEKKCKRKSKRYEWANKSGRYKWDLKDWLRLCKSCHNIYDDIGNKVWKIRRKKYGRKNNSNF